VVCCYGKMLVNVAARSYRHNTFLYCYITVANATVNFLKMVY
jgi:hypothetical protein